MENYYDWIKVAHIVSMTAWMVGMFYLPRLYVYHAQAKIGSESDKLFKTMERRLLRVIMNPAMVLVTIMGLLLIYIYGFKSAGIWFHIKISLVLCLFGIHGLLAKWRVDFEKGKNTRSPTFYKIINESVSVIFILIVIMVIIKPFDD